MSRRAGFSLLEILLVLAVIGLLLGAGTVVLNPARRLAGARNQQRELDLQRLETAVKQYRLVEGEYPSGITSTETEICDAGLSGSPACDGFVDLSGLVPEFLQAIPEDPNDEDSANGNGYTVRLSSNGVLTLRAINAELGETIQVN